MKLETGLIDVGTFNKLYTEGTIFPYKKNRGGAIFDRKRVNKYAKSWRPESSGCAVLEKTSEGYMLRDFHNRAEALKIGIKSGEISPKEEILIRVLPPGDGLNAYRDINAAKNHTSVEKLMNTDLIFGYNIQRILSYTKAFENQAMLNKFNIHICQLILDLKVSKRSDFAFTRSRSWMLARFKDASIEDGKEIEISDQQAKTIAKSIDYWAAIRDAIEAEGSNSAGEVSQTITRIVKSSQLFGFVIFDNMFNRKLGSVDQVSKNIVRFQRKVEKIVPMIQMGSMEEMLENGTQLFQVLNTK